MSQTNSQNIANSLLFYLIMVVIVASGIGISIYKNQHDIKINNSLLITPTPEVTITLKPTIKPTKKLNSMNRPGLVFIDKNSNGKKDGGEQGCDICIAKSLVLAQVTNNTYPALKDLAESAIGGSGIINTQELIKYNTAWGFYEDRDLLIKPTVLLNNDGNEDINIPAQEIKVNIGGINANIAQIIKVDEKPGVSFTVRYYFVSPLPAMEDTLKAGKEIWVYLKPDDKQLGKTYLASGKLEINSDTLNYNASHYLEIVWPIGGYLVQSTKKNNIGFILL